MEHIKSDNKKIAKNTLFLYGRELLTLLLALYSSRILLEKLGVDDFGLYGLIGSILTMFSSLRGLFSSSIQRFINVEKALGNIDNVNKIFSLGVVIHVIIALVFIIIVEVAGVIIIPTLNISPTSISSAYNVLHLSVLATAITILTVPYDALIIANERFNAFALISILEAVLKLSVIFILDYSVSSKVVFYALLLLIVSLVVRSTNALYCRHVFKTESKFCFVKDKELLKQMFSFAGWQFFGNLGYSLMHTGLNFLINVFGGVAVNAARTIAYQVQTAVYKLSSNINISFQPQSIMLYSQGKKNEYYKMMIINTKASFAITIIMSMIIIIMAPSILNIWLGDVPQHTTEMVQAIFAYTIIRSLHSPIDTLFKAAGELKHYQICELVILSLNLPLSLLALKAGCPYYSIFIIMAIVEIINLFSIILIAKKKLGFDTALYLRNIAPRTLLMIIVCVLIFVLLNNFSETIDSLFLLLCNCLMVFVFIITLVFLIVFSKKERTSIIGSICRKIKIW